MTTPQSSSKIVDVEACVRGNTGSAALCGGLLVFFGFFFDFGGASGSVLGDTLFHWTLRAGGLLMITAAVWCSIGVPVALLLDAVLLILIGVLLTISAVLMTVGGGIALPYPVYVICGVILITYGIRDLRDYRRFPSEDDVFDAQESDEDSLAFGEPVERASLVSPLPPAGEPGEGPRRSPSSPDTGADGLLSTFAKKNKSTKR